MPEEVAKPEAAKVEEKKEELYPLDTEKEPVATQHKLGDLEYTATTGMLPLKNEFGETEGEEVFGMTRPILADTQEPTICFLYFAFCTR